MSPIKTNILLALLAIYLIVLSYMIAILHKEVQAANAWLISISKQLEIDLVD